MALAARNPDKLADLAAETGAKIHQCDASQIDQVAALFDATDASIGTPDMVVYNPSARVRGPITELDPAATKAAIETTCFGAFLVAQQAAIRMCKRGSGSILFTGASAGIKGFANSSVFAMGKFGLAGWPNHWRASFIHKIFISAILSLMVGSRPTTAVTDRMTERTRCSTRMKLPKPILLSTTSIAVPGRGRLNCAHG